jgi:hypothetical protein
MEFKKVFILLKWDFGRIFDQFEAGIILYYLSRSAREWERSTETSEGMHALRKLANSGEGGSCRMVQGPRSTVVTHPFALLDLSSVAPQTGKMKIQAHELHVELMFYLWALFNVIIIPRTTWPTMYELYQH